MKGKRNREEENPDKLHGEIKATQRTLQDNKFHMRREIQKAKANAWQQLLDTLQQDPWGKPYKIIRGKLKRSLSLVTKMMNIEDTAEVLDQLFPKPSQRNSTTDNGDDTDRTVREVVLTNKNEVKKAIKNSQKPINKAPGPDGVSRETWSLIPDIFLDKICNVFNTCLETGTFPEQWKTARLVLIPKADKPGEPRGIDLYAY